MAGTVCGFQVKRIVEQAEAAGGELMLRPGEPEHEAVITEMLKELAPERYPRTYEAIGRRKAENSALFSEKGTENGWEDGFFLPFVRWEQGKVHAKAVLSTAQNCYELMTVLCLCDLSAGEQGALVDRSELQLCFPPRHTLSQDAWLKGEAKEAVVLQFSGWVDREERFKAAVKVRRLPAPEQARRMAEERGPREVPMRSPAVGMSILNLDLTAPVHTKTAAGEPIVLSFGRSYQAGEKIDYPFDPTSQDRFHFPCSGAAVFRDQSVRFIRALEPGSNSASLMILVRDGGGILEYKGKFSDHTAKSASGFSWDFSDERWKAQPGFRWDAYFGAKLYFTLEYETDRFAPNPVLTVNSTEDEQDDKVKIDTIAVYWGCLAADTPVTMADGSRKELRQIRIGERVRAPQGELRVENILTGTEEEGLWKLTVERGESVLTTRLHPILTTEGFKAAWELCPGVDSLVLEDGEASRLQDVAVERICRQEVWNLELSGSGGDSVPVEEAVFFAGGIAVGDNQVQGWISRRNEERRQAECGLPAEWKTDVDSAVHQFAYLKDVDILWK